MALLPARFASAHLTLGARRRLAKRRIRRRWLARVVTVLGQARLQPGDALGLLLDDGALLDQQRAQTRDLRGQLVER